jgi:hypothetical protein
MTSEYDQSPSLPAITLAKSLATWPTFTVVTPMSGEATSPANPRQTAHKQI